MPNPTVDNNFWAYNQDRVDSQLWRSLFAYRLFKPNFTFTKDFVLKKGLLLLANATPVTGVVDSFSPYPVGTDVQFAVDNACAILAEDLTFDDAIGPIWEIRVLEFGIVRKDFLYGLEVAAPTVNQKLRPQDVDSLRANGIVALEVDDQTLFDNAGSGI